MLLRTALTVLAALLVSSSLALASEFDGWTLRQITSHPDFTRDTNSMSSAHNHGGPGKKRVCHWIGYIPSGDRRVYFTSFGEPLTCVRWEKTGEWVPEWAIDALDRLEEEGYIRLNVPGPATSAPETVIVEGRG